MIEIKILSDFCVEASFQYHDMILFDKFFGVIVDDYISYKKLLDLDQFQDEDERERALIDFERSQEQLHFLVRTTIEEKLHDLSLVDE